MGTKPSPGYENTLYIYHKGTESKQKNAEKNTSKDGVNGYWTEHQNIDMYAQGDVEFIQKWKSRHSIEDLKKMVEQRGYSAISLNKQNKFFDFAAFKTFDYQLEVHHTKPSP